MRKNSAPRAEGQTLHMFFLGIILTRIVDLPARSRFMSERQTTQFRSSRNVAFDKRRRYLKAADDVVESVAGIISR